MKTKVMAVVSMLVFALAMMAQTATPTAPAAGDAKTCACCNQADAKTSEKMDCCGKDVGCCKDGTCDMKAHKDGKMACCSGDRCPVTAQKDGKASCCGDKCPMMKGGKSSAGLSGGGKGGCCETAKAASCCAKGAACCKGGYMPCCGGENKAA